MNQDSKVLNNNENFSKMKKTNRSSDETDKPVDFKINSNKLIEQRPRSSGFKSFLNWFKKVENLQHPVEVSDSDDESSDEESSSSSTATVASFAFLPANKYKPYGDAIPPEKYFSNGPYTETYDRLMMERNRRRSIDKNVTLRRKYSLYSSGTINPHAITKDDTIDENEQYEPFDTFSLPSLSKIRANNLNNCKDNRKTASLSSHYKKPHVKGKRRAPQPPITTDFIRSYRKKRKAPPPPLISEEIVIKNVVEKCDKPIVNKNNNLIEKNNKTNSIAKDTNVPTIEHSPKLWYKRESKQKIKNTINDNAKKKTKHEFPEVGFFRCSQLFDNIRNMNSNKSDADSKNEKRVSRYLPNISELDREAAEIIKQSKSNAKNEQWINNPAPNPSSARELITKFNALAKPTEANKNISQPMNQSALMNKKNEIKLSNDLILNDSKEKVFEPKNNILFKENNSHINNNLQNKEFNKINQKIPAEGDISKSFKSEIFSALPDLAPSTSNNDNISVQNQNEVKLNPSDKQKILDMEERIKLRLLLKEMKNSLPKRTKPNGTKPTINDDLSKINHVENKTHNDNLNITNEDDKSKLIVIENAKKELSDIIIANADKKIALKSTEIIKNLPKTQIDPIYSNKVSSFAQTNCILRKNEQSLNNDVNKASSSNEAKVIEIKTETKEALYTNIKEAKQDYAIEIDNSKLNIIDDNAIVHNSTNVLLKKLEQAIAEGDDISAANFAKDLAMQKVNCLVTCSPYINASEQNCHRIKIYIEDQFSHQGPLPLQILENTTMGQLKDKVEKELNIPILAQRWIIGKQLAASDDVLLSKYNNNDFETPLFLYVIALDKTPSLIINESITDKEKENTKPGSSSTPNIITDSPAIKKTSNGIVKEFKNPEIINDSIRASIASKSITQASSSVSPELKNVTKNTWICTDCTLINSLLSPLCSACGLKKPESAKSTKETVIVKIDNPANHYKQLLNLDNRDLIFNMENFECPICFLNCKPNEGIMLRECLHSFCKDCLGNTIKYCDDAEIKCPYRDKMYFCDSVIQEREIRSLVEKTVYEKHLAKSVKFAEHKIQNTFHCKTPDCKGWCIFDDNVNHFLCPACKKNNCLTCQVIHEGKNCKEYQDQIQNKNAPDKNEGQQTKNMLDEMVSKGEAMACPSCEVIMMKKWGCDWVRCSMCKTEICWVTRGPRWGPSGKGDVSAGCQCGINGVKCHPKCNYCH